MSAADRSWVADYNPTGRATVVNCRTTPYTRYIGRPSAWGNPFIIGKHGTRAQVLKRYEHWFCLQERLIDLLPSLRGEVLGCFCAPEPCHGHFLADLVNNL